MSVMNLLDSSRLMKWLEELGVHHYLCGQCKGVHISELQSLDGVVESRIFLEEDCMVFCTELEIRPSSLIPLTADVQRLNACYTTLKVFLDFNDESSPRMIVSDNLLVGSGITKEQLNLFMLVTQESTLAMMSECQEADYIWIRETAEINTESKSLH